MCDEFCLKTGHISMGIVHFFPVSSNAVGVEYGNTPNCTKLSRPRWP